MITKKEAEEWIIAHDAYDWDVNRVAKEMMVEAINNTVWAEDVYPGIKARLIDAVMSFSADSV